MGVYHPALGYGIMPAIAYIFPGQGSQTPGMGRELAQAYPEAQAVFNEADAVLGFSLSRVLFEGSEEDLRATEVAQPALLTHSVAVLRCLQWRNLQPVAVAGHSLGEYSALVAAGALNFADAVQLVRKRGLLMARAAQEHPGSMAAVLGMENDRVAAFCREVSQECGSDEIVVPANFNAPGQVVISGTAAAVKRASEQLKAEGASRVIPLAVSGAFHSPLMHEAACSMEEELSKVTFKDASVPVVANISAQVVQTPEGVRSALAAQVEGSVRWEESLRTLAAMGVTHFIELGPGRVLCGLVRKTIPQAKTHSIADPAGLDGLSAFLEQGT